MNAVPGQARGGKRGRWVDDGPKLLGPADATPGRVPPHDLDAEAAVLSCFLLEPSKLDEAPHLRAEDFYSPSNRLIFEAIRVLSEARAMIDTTTVGTWLKDRGRLPEIGGVPYLARIVDAAPAVANLLAYVETVRQKARVRAIVSASQLTAAEGYGDVGDVDKWAQTAEQRMFELAHRSETSAPTGLGDTLVATMRRVEEAARRGDAILGLPTGFDKYDERTSGLHPGDLNVVAGRPGMGKTSFVLNIAVNVASPKKNDKGEETDGGGVAIFTLEMPKDQIVMRLLCAESMVDVGRFRRGQLSPVDWSRLTPAAQFLKPLPIEIDDTPALTLLDLRAKVRLVERKFAMRGIKLGLVIVDYLQLMGAPPTFSGNREQEIGINSRGLKQLAKEMSVPVYALSQLNRMGETSGDKRPQLSHLRESGSIEQDADTVTFIHRDGYHDAGSEIADVAEIITAKQRNGPTGSDYAMWHSAATRFTEPTPLEHASIAERLAQKREKAQSKKGGFYG